ncbi:MAG: hypothetical protein ABIC19_04775, partial [Patescibacteria group bacterium]
SENGISFSGSDDLWDMLGGGDETICICFGFGDFSICICINFSGSDDNNDNNDNDNNDDNNDDGDYSNCTALNPSGLTKYDDRIPLVFIGDDDFLDDEDYFQEKTAELAELKYYPFDTESFTVWRSEKLGENACPANNLAIKAYLYKYNSSDPNGQCSQGSFGYTYLNNEKLWLCMENLEPREDDVGRSVLAHQIGHDFGLYDEHSAGYQPGNHNCYAGSDACGYFQSIVSTYDCGEIKSGCSSDSQYRSSENSVMFDMTSDIGYNEVCQELFKREIESRIGSTTEDLYYFIAIHNEPYHDEDESIADHYEILKDEIEEADSYNIKLTLMFSPQWVDHIKEEDLRAWKDKGHEIAAHHHDIYHAKNWDGYTDYSREDAEARRRELGKTTPETYLGTLEDFTEKLKQINSNINSGCTGEEANKNLIPNKIIYGTCSGYANYGTPGTRMIDDDRAEKGKNEFMTVGPVDEITRKWLAHYKVSEGGISGEEAAEEMFNSMDSGVYGIVLHSVLGEKTNYHKFLEFLHEKDPKGEKSKTVSEIIENNLIPEKEIEVD